MRDEKYTTLLGELQKYTSVAVAWSGGVDSTLLLQAAIDALGADKVTALHATSELCSEKGRILRKIMIEEDFPSTLSFIEICLHPLFWPGFAENSPRRCYLCKRNLYTALQAVSGPAGLQLVDGTNFDDLSQDRPGLQALAELAVPAPLAAVGLKKSEVRRYARLRGLRNHDLPADSCLATRLPAGRRITPELLQLIAHAESSIAELGFSGHRVRLEEWGVTVAIADREISAATEMKEQIDMALRYLLEDKGLFSGVFSPRLQIISRKTD